MKMPIGPRRVSGSVVCSWTSIRVLCMMAVLACVSILMTPAQAAFPGADGRIAFVSDRTGSPQIFTMAPDGSHVRQITSFARAAAFEPAWAPDGSSIVFGKAPSGARFDSIWVTNPSGTDQRRLVGDGWFRYIQPSYSPDGSTIVFSRCYPDFSKCDLETADADGGNIQRLTPFREHHTYDQNAQFSPDGTQIAFTSFDRDGVVAATYVMDADGTDITRVTPVRLGASGPDWSPDGSTLAVWTHCCDPKIATIVTVNPDGSGLTPLTDPTPSHDFLPAYAPSGGAIVFERDLPDFSRFDIWVMAPDGSGQTRLTKDGFAPAWGPA
jgi:Tol biopolymer transport system component